MQQQKLLSIGDDDVDVIQPIVRRPDILPRGIQQLPGGIVRWDDDILVADESMQSVWDGGIASAFQAVAMLGTSVVVCGFGMQFCRRRSRQRRKHIHFTPAARRSRTAR